MIRGAAQNNLKNLDVDFKTGKITVVTGVSGSGKSSLVFDTLYAEGQRRYAETFSPYARQFLDRMDRPHVNRIEGVPPAIAIDQVNPVRTSRSTVGTMTEINDYLKILFSQSARLYCPNCGRPVQNDSPESIYGQLNEIAREYGDPRLYVTFKTLIPATVQKSEVLAALQSEGFTSILKETDDALWVAADKFRFSHVEKSRVLEAVETALRFGKGSVEIFTSDGDDIRSLRRFSADLSCPDCGIHFQKPGATSFSFNSPVGACPVCRGFGRVQDFDYSLAIPDDTLSLSSGAVKIFTTPANQECYLDMMRLAPRFDIRTEIPFRELSEREKNWVINGEPGWSGRWKTQWYGLKNFFKYLETKVYKMHVAVFLSKYRTYLPCPSCHGARLKDEWLYWRVGSSDDTQACLHGLIRFRRFKPGSVTMPEAVFENLPGLNLFDLMSLPLENLKIFMDRLLSRTDKKNPSKVVLEAICSRLSYLNDVGLGYLTLDRQSRTLSGGEVQRIALTTALGASLVNTLFVLDEPSVGLHPRDMDRIIRILKKIRDAGNTLVIVEHDPDVMLSADLIYDMGPGPGDQGGQIVFKGTPSEIMQSDTLTGRFLREEFRPGGKKARPVDSGTAFLELRGAREHNLKNITVRFPKQRFSVVTGVSGSGKSTLIENVLVPAILKARKEPAEQPGAFESVAGFEDFAEVTFVDQSAIGRSSRSNPASYVGAFDAIRNIFVKDEVARARGYTPGTFSFNSGDGRCPACKGSGYERVEMMFLSDVLLTCPECGGKRFRPEVLEITVERKGRTMNIADVLDLTVDTACSLFESDNAVIRLLEPLRKVGLGYIRLGQSVSTLSGGEAQRLKIAGYLAEKSLLHSLFIFDEPTSGLHFADTQKLMNALEELVDNGSTVIVIEHNLDVVNAADWVVDLGPEGGERGGEVVYEGPIEGLLQEKRSYTAQALVNLRTRQNTVRKNQAPQNIQEKAAPYDSITVRGAREHNLKNISLKIPHNAFSVVTGVSGSGKSTLAFDVIFREGQRRYLESLNAYARSVVQTASAPDVDSITGIAPTVAIEQRTSRGGLKSTVATMTEIYHFLRLLFVRLGTQMCPDCRIEVSQQSPEEIASKILRRYKDRDIVIYAPLVIRRKGIYKDIAKWASGKGYKTLRVDGKIVPTEPFPSLSRFKEHNIELPLGTQKVQEERRRELLEELKKALIIGKGSVLVTSEDDSGQLFSASRSCPRCGRGFPELDPRLFSFNSSMGWCPACHGTGLVSADAEEYSDSEGFDWSSAKTCPVCKGARLNDIALNVFFEHKNISEITAMNVETLCSYFSSISLSDREAAVAHDAIEEIRSRLSFLREVGLGYLSLDRASPTLSGGEAQRIRLASQLGSNLQGVCYILDEPTIGLHPKDNALLLNTIRNLSSKGNTLLVVEHDEETIREADHIIDMGPGAGSRGGRVIASGNLEDILKNKNSITGRYLNQPVPHSFVPREPIDRNTQWLTIIRPKLNNLKMREARLPLSSLCVITGVSGSGKSSLARGILMPALKACLDKKARPFENCEAVTGWESLRRVLEVDQSPIGKTPRSCPATYIGFMDDIRRIFSESPMAKERGFNSSRFSFNTASGRCPICEGKGMRTVEMHFLSDVSVVCEACSGLRYNESTLEIKYKGKSIGEVLQMDAEEALEFFSAHSKIRGALQLMVDVGLGYLTLGQPSHTLSGGEAQRIKLVTELVKAVTDLNRGDTGAGRTLYILDEPTVGLHMADVHKLTDVLHRLVEAGNTVVVIEHNLDVIAEADWVLDLGPDGGENGGKIAAQGTPADITQCGTYTGRILAKFRKNHPAQS